jgi:hypothetical protein
VVVQHVTYTSDSDNMSSRRLFYEYCSVFFYHIDDLYNFIVGIRGRDSCGEHFMKLKILPLHSQYILSLLLFVVDNGDYFNP